MKYKCVTDGFKTRGCKVDNSESGKWMRVVNGEILDCDGEYMLNNFTIEPIETYQNLIYSNDFNMLLFLKINLQ